MNKTWLYRPRTQFWHAFTEGDNVSLCGLTHRSECQSAGAKRSTDNTCRPCDIPEGKETRLSQDKFNRIHTLSPPAMLGRGPARVYLNSNGDLELWNTDNAGWGVARATEMFHLLKKHLPQMPEQSEARQASDDPSQLRESLISFARELTSEQFHNSGSYETTPEDRIEEAIAQCKASIGEGLLKALGAG